MVTEKLTGFDDWTEYFNRLALAMANASTNFAAVANASTNFEAAANVRYSLGQKVQADCGDPCGDPPLNSTKLRKTRRTERWTCRRRRARRSWWKRSRER